MHFYVDETGHTGPNLFDHTQPILSYGVLSSRFDLNEVAEKKVVVLRKKFGVKRLHAAELGISKLSEAVDTLLSLQKDFKLRFDVWQVHKCDHAIISFFDQVFDQGMNPAVTWTGYWTPLRYVLLLKLAYLFDEDLAKKAWTARLEAHDGRSAQLFNDVCNELLLRVPAIPDARSQELIADALNWAKANFVELGYNCKTNKDRLRIMPNMIGFQSVIHGICARLNSPNQKPTIIVDQQSQFNTTQQELRDFYFKVKETPWQIGPGLPVMDMRKMPIKPLVFQSGTENTGLELVDIYLWVFKRFMENKELTKPLQRLIYTNRDTARTASVSLDAISELATNIFDNMPEPTAEQITKGHEYFEMDEQRRLSHRVAAE
ncbi:DUF3800 domain-containing protein [Salmonella enterica subsp. enterica]|nr:DUF3800 domain-containing protein [Salmonella enterica subsp. enterica]EIY5764757.1 DUF3800 domain-containing protein [Salmonella enterica subsp. enterica]EIY5769097.1 DUF3800 domain-containing protein [Salmonella enterica subsp. enterica]